jgi:hypothetical protein
VAGPAAAAGSWRFEPDVRVGVGYSDNITLEDGNLKEEETFLELRPTLRLRYEGSRVEGEAAYALEHYAFERVSDRDATYHQFNGNLDTEIVPEMLFLDTEALYSQTLVNPLQGLPYSNVIDTGNRANFFAAAATPRFARDIGSSLRLDVSYRLGIVDYEDLEQFGPDVTLEDLDERTLRVLFGTRTDDRTLSWEARFYDQTFEFQEAISTEYRIADLRVGYRVSPNLTLLATGGTESDVRENQSRGALDASLWTGGFRWEPSQQFALETNAGERWFGTTWDLEMRYEGRRIESGATYNESPMTVGQQMFQRPVLDTPQPGDPIGGIGRNTPELYLSKAGEAWLALQGRRNRIGLTYYRDRRIFLTSNLFETERGVRADWTYVLGPRTSFNLEATLQRIGYIASTREDDFIAASATLTRQIGARTEIELNIRHNERSSDAVPIDPIYSENSAILRFRWSWVPLRQGLARDEARGGPAERRRDDRRRLNR